MKFPTLLPALFVLTLPNGAFADPLRMATPYADSFFQTQNVREFAENVTELTAGAVSFDIHPGSTLVSHTEIPGAVANGELQAGEFFLSILSGDDAIFGLDSLPFVATDYGSAADLWDEQRPLVQSALRERGLIALYAVPWPPQGLYSRVEISDPAQLDGMAFRTYNATLETLATLMGATPVRVEVADIPEAIARDELDVMLTSASTGVSTQSWDYFPYFYDIQAWLPKNIVVMNAATFDALPPQTQQQVLAAAQEAEDRGRISSMIDAVEAVKVLFDRGVTILTTDTEVMETSDGLSMGPVSPALITAFEQASGDLLAQWADTAGEDAVGVVTRLRGQAGG
ncbi:TRAP transporter substrate-binding protein [Pontivivens insulae]|uniref:2,3-diketo-L-gulonate-binding periplasmic protein YiaO n=1 Tax=Pontivivens insulae TaxID=1639689 RepID=A0A2R8AF64_9RHOB|nr:TRAP transporter substrate-binding protein [Pontivivens insulae]RED12123.1 TRAP-type C4-dicarboxylate transport system substrate-binding protein [Pontivivens insulae]SPF30879.1 2,3-diketo-L-gulonate-binding periplasmic protein YiaO [Pontivivens insulae]